MANNLFLNAKELMLQNDGLNYVNYETLSEEHKEFLTTTNWDFEWTTVPNAVYFPGNALMKARTRAVSPNFNTNLSSISAIIRQFTIYQAVRSGTTEGTMTIDYTDREDQAINAWIQDWVDKISDKENRYSFRKEDTIANGRITMYNSSRKPLRIYDMLTIQPQDPGTGLNVPFSSDDAAQAGDISVTFHFEHFRNIWKNL